MRLPGAPGCAGDMNCRCARASHAVQIRASRARHALHAARRRTLAWLHLRDFGAGEGIRTLDPDLGKVVLYP